MSVGLCCFVFQPFRGMEALLHLCIQVTCEQRQHQTPGLQGSHRQHSKFSHAATGIWPWLQVGWYADRLRVAPCGSWSCSGRLWQTPLRFWTLFHFCANAIVISDSMSLNPGISVFHTIKAMRQRAFESRCSL